MAKYAPGIDWKPQGRVTRVICDMCPDTLISPTLVGARAHLLAHRDHHIALVATTTTILSIPDGGDDIVHTPVRLPATDSFHVPA